MEKRYDQLKIILDIKKIIKGEYYYLKKLWGYLIYLKKIRKKKTIN